MNDWIIVGIILAINVIAALIIFCTIIRLWKCTHAD